MFRACSHLPPLSFTFLDVATQVLDSESHYRKAGFTEMTPDFRDSVLEEMAKFSEEVCSCLCFPVAPWLIWSRRGCNFCGTSDESGVAGFVRLLVLFLLLA